MITNLFIPENKIHARLMLLNKIVLRGLELIPGVFLSERARHFSGVDSRHWSDQIKLDPAVVRI